jgi:hypothetical protein
MKPVSAKRQAQLRAYYALVMRLKLACGCHSEWSSECCTVYDIEPHHIDGRRGDRLLDPFNIILLNAEEHKHFQAHNSWQVRQALKMWIRPVRLAQGFKK